MIEYSLDEKALIFLSHFEFMTHTRAEKILALFKTPAEIFNISSDCLKKIEDILKEYYSIFIKEYERFDMDMFFKKLADKKVYCLTIISKNYPEKLTRLKNPPMVLYYFGDIDLLNSKSIAIVGTRRPSNYGKLVTEKFSKALAKSGVTIISGLAEGVDGISHQGALAVDGKTIAVLGGGFDHIFPEINVSLAREIARKGLVITEYYPSIKATKYTFPARNRIIAGLSDAILITEAKVGSGSLYTKEYGDDVGIDTYAVPGNINSENSEATNNLIKSGEAGCVTMPEDILLDLNIITSMPQSEKSGKCGKQQTKEKNIPSNVNLSINQIIIYELLKDGEKDFLFLQEKTNFDTQTLNYNLTTLEISGIIKKLAGNSYMIID